MIIDIGPSSFWLLVITNLAVVAEVRGRASCVTRGAYPLKVGRGKGGAMVYGGILPFSLFRIPVCKVKFEQKTKISGFTDGNVLLLWWNRECLETNQKWKWASVTSIAVFVGCFVLFSPLQLLVSSFPTSTVSFYPSDEALLLAIIEWSWPTRKMLLCSDTTRTHTPGIFTSSSSWNREIFLHSV